MGIRIRMRLEKAEDVDDLEHYATCDYHGLYLLELLLDGSRAALAKSRGNYPLVVELDMGEFRPGLETESDADEPTEEDATAESDNPFAPRRQAPTSA